MLHRSAGLALAFAVLAMPPASLAEGPAEWPVAFSHPLTRPDVLKRLLIGLGQYGGHVQVEGLLGLRMAGAHTLSVAWLDTPVAEQYRLSFLFSFTKEGTLRLWLSGPGYGCSDCLGYGLRLGREGGEFFREDRLVARFTFPEKLALNQPYPVECVREGPRVSLTIGGSRVVEFVDPEPLEGVLHSRVAIGVHQGRDGTGVRYRDIELRRPPLTEEEQEALADIQFVPPETILPKEPVAALLQATAEQMMAPPWLHTQKHAVNLMDGRLFVGGPNASPGCFHTEPLTGPFALDTTFNYIKPVYPMPGWNHGLSWQRNVARRGGAALNLRILLLYADRVVPREEFVPFLKQPRTGWEIQLPDCIGMTTVKWLGGGRSQLVAKTPYYTPLPGRTQALRVEREGGRLRLFLDGRFLLEARQPIALPGQDRLPMYYAVCEHYESVLIHGVAADRITPDVADF